MSDTLITLPFLGDSVTEGVIGHWLKEIGENVHKGEPLVEIQSDKVNLEVEAPEDGVLEAILAQEGESVPIGAELGRLGDGSQLQVSEPPATPTAAGQERPSPAEPARPSAAVSSSGPPIAPPPGKRGRTRAPQSAPTKTAASAAGSEHQRGDTAPGLRLISPAALRLAEQYHIALDEVPGSGLGGRIKLADVQELLTRGPRPEGAVSLSPQDIPRPSAPATPGPDSITTDGAVVVPITPIRRAIAAAMSRSRSEIPDAWSTVEIDMSAATRRRAQLKDELTRRTSAPLSFVALFAEAVQVGLRAVPQVNASWSEAGLLLHHALHLGIAVAGPRGLVAPVVHHAERLSLEGLAVAIHQLVEKGRSDQLSPEDLRGGTFTVNNAGALGSVLTQAIPVPGQAGIVTMEAITKRLVVLNDDTIAIRPMMNTTLSFDHRIVDGAEALQFLGAVKNHLEHGQ